MTCNSFGNHKKTEVEGAVGAGGASEVGGGGGCITFIGEVEGDVEEDDGKPGGNNTIAPGCCLKVSSTPLEVWFGDRANYYFLVKKIWLKDLVTGFSYRMLVEYCFWFQKDLVKIIVAKKKNKTKNLKKK